MSDARHLKGTGRTSCQYRLCPIEGMQEARARGSLNQVSAPARAAAQPQFAILKRETECCNSSAVLASSRTSCVVERVPSPVCSVTAKMC